MTKQKPLLWVDNALKYIGTAEIPGVKTNATIAEWLEELGLPWKDDETPWCAVFVSAVLKRSNRGLTASPAWARSFINYGTRLEHPAYGAIATKYRAGSGGHVFIVVGVTDKGKIVGLGGNQSDKVCLCEFNSSDIVSYSWPPSKDGMLLVPTSDRYNLPIYKSGTLKLSNKED